MKRRFNTTWSYNKYADRWELAPGDLSCYVFVAHRSHTGKWNLVRGCTRTKLIGIFRYLAEAKRAAILYQELNFLIKL